MLFYTSNEEDFELIPSTYIVFGISKNLSINHPNYQTLETLIPTSTSKKDYKQKLCNNLTLLNLVSLLHKNSHSNSIVLVCSQKDIDKYTFNYIKKICKTIEKKYGYKYYKFENTVTRSMRDLAVFSSDGLDKFIIDFKRATESIPKGE